MIGEAGGTAVTVEPAHSVDPEELTLVLRSGVLDADWYLARYPDVAAADVDPTKHFMQSGWRESRDPGPHFSTAWYVTTYLHGEVPQNPLVHYLKVGWKHGNEPSPRFKTADFLQRHPEAALLNACPLTVALAIARTQGLGQMPDTASPFDDLEVRTWTPAAVAPPSCRARIAAFYLPQFHPIPENDRWWGEGFTEWANVTRGESRYPGHVQPHVPLELGYYDLRDSWVMARQVELARLHGINAFVFYRYWFSGQTLLDMPLNHFRDSPYLDLEYAVCWANESWTRRWNGESGDVLIEQEYSPGLDIDFIEQQVSYFADARYLRIQGRPVLLVYRPLDLPDPTATTRRWRDWCRENGVGEIHLVAVNALEDVDPLSFGFDASAEFWPNNGQLPELTGSLTGTEYQGRVYDWTTFVERSRNLSTPPSPLYRGLCVSWDNEARRPGEGTSLFGANPAGFREWLRNVVGEAEIRFREPEERLVFVNAWNEWAEGCHLEPDTLWGYQWLHSVRDVQCERGDDHDEWDGIGGDDVPKALESW